jgi:hypothetical protein
VPDAWRSGFRILAEVRCLFSKIVQTGLGSIQPPSQWVSEFIPGVKRLGHEADHSVPTSAEVTNQWSYTFTPPIRLHDDERYNFTLYRHHIIFTNPCDLIPLCTLRAGMAIRFINKTFVFTNNIQNDIIYAISQTNNWENITCNSRVLYVYVKSFSQFWNERYYVTLWSTCRSKLIYRVRDSWVGIATGYGFGGPWIESR